MAVQKFGPTQLGTEFNTTVATAGSHSDCIQPEVVTAVQCTAVLNLVV